MNAVQCKMARVAIGLGVRDLASLANVAQATVSRLERGEDLKDRTVLAIRTALEAAGVEFIAENGGGAGVRVVKNVDRYAGLPFPVFTVEMPFGNGRFGVFRNDKDYNTWRHLTIVQMNEIRDYGQDLQEIQDYWLHTLRMENALESLLSSALECVTGPRKPKHPSSIGWGFIQPENVFPSAREYRANFIIDWEGPQPKIVDIESTISLSHKRSTIMNQLPIGINWWKYD